jgi:uncharacterized protein YjiS (DUF1127 family)
MTTIEAPSGVAAATGLTSIPPRLITWWRQRRERRRHYAALDQLSDYLRRDIGLPPAGDKHAHWR